MNLEDLILKALAQLQSETGADFVDLDEEHCLVVGVDDIAVHRIEWTQDGPVAGRQLARFRLEMVK